MKTHIIKSKGELLIFTKCGKAFWHTINLFHINPVITDKQHLVTCKTCRKLMKK